MLWNRAHQMNQRQRNYQHQIPRNGRETGHRVRVVRCFRGFEQNVEEVGEEDMEWLLVVCLIES